VLVLWVYRVGISPELENSSVTHSYSIKIEWPLAEKLVYLRRQGAVSKSALKETWRLHFETLNLRFRASRLQFAPQRSSEGRKETAYNTQSGRVCNPLYNYVFAANSLVRQFHQATRFPSTPLSLEIWWMWYVAIWGISRPEVHIWLDVSEECIGTILRFENQQSKKLACSGWLGIKYQLLRKRLFFQQTNIIHSVTHGTVLVTGRM
jgi:hypothetical protein